MSAMRMQFKGCRGGPLSRPTQPRTIPAALGPLLKIKRIEDVASVEPSNDTGIEDYELIATYNLLDKDSSAILVPGSPPLWTPLPAHTRIRSDSGTYFRDENAARFPTHPMEPSVRSVLTLKPDFNTSSIDIFACGGTLGDILRFSIGKGQPFTFIVHVIGNTAFFVRRNNSPTEIIDNVSGFGHSFPEANTTWGRAEVGSHSHQRIICYTLGNLKLLVRFEGDAATLDDLDDDDEVTDASDDRRDENIAVKAASWTMGNSVPSQSKPVGAVTAQAPAKIISRGRLVSQSSVLDIKTRSSWKSKDEVMAEQLPRLWIRQIHKLVLAFHTKGDFDNAEVLDISADMRNWESESAAALGIYTRLVGDIRKTAMVAKGNKIEVRGSEASYLEFRELVDAEQQSWDALPHDLERQWET